MARMSIHTGDVRRYSPVVHCTCRLVTLSSCGCFHRGAKIAKVSPSVQLKRECAEILEGLKVPYLYWYSSDHVCDLCSVS